MTYKDEVKGQILSLYLLLFLHDVAAEDRHELSVAVWAGSFNWGGRGRGGRVHCAYWNYYYL